MSSIEQKIRDLDIEENIESTISDKYYVKILYDNGKTEKILADCLNEEFELAYCTTIHKAQGSQYENIVLFMHKEHNYSWSSLDRGIFFTLQ